MGKILKVILLMLVIVQGLVTVPAMGETIVDTSPSNTGSFTPWGLDGGTDQWLASEFNLSKSTTISSVYGWIERLAFDDTDSNGNPYPFTITIYADGGNIPGTQLFTNDFYISTRGANWYGLSGLNWSLDSGDYWVAFEVRTRPGNPQSYAMMPGAFQNYLIYDAVYNNGTWSAMYPPTPLKLGIKIEGNSVPEPTTMLLLGLGLIGLAGARRKFRK